MEMTREVLNILESLAAEGVCMLSVTHEMAFAKGVASRIIFMEYRCYGDCDECDYCKEANGRRIYVKVHGNGR